MLLANLLFSVVDTSTKWLLGAGLAIVQLAFMRYAVHFALTFGESRFRLGLEPMRLRTHLLVLLRAFCLVSATVVNFTALGQLPLSVTSAIMFFAPVFVCLFARPILGEVITRAHWIGVATGFIGVLVVVWPIGQPVNWYAVLMIYPAAGLAMYQVLTRLLAGEATIHAMQLYTGILGTAALLPFAAFAWVAPPGPLSWVLLLAIGTFAWAGHQALSHGHRFAPASTLAPFGYSFVIFVSLGGWLIFSETPTLNVICGAGLIFLAGLLLWRAA